MAGLTQARWPSWPLLRRAESASREGDALPRPSFRGCLFGSSLLHRAPPPDKQAAASRSRPPCEACQGGLLMRSRCKPCRCRCNPSEFQRLLVALPCYSAPLGAGTRVPILGLQRSPPTTKVHTVSPCEQGEHRRPRGSMEDGGSSRASADQADQARSGVRWHSATNPVQGSRLRKGASRGPLTLLVIQSSWRTIIPNTCKAPQI